MKLRLIRAMRYVIRERIMQTKILAPQSMEVINSYLHLPFPDKDVSCPYFNNRRAKVRVALRVKVGKGSVDDIVEEATLISLRDKIDLQKLASAQLKQFLVDNNLGIDCSGFAYYVLDAELKVKGKGRLKTHLKFPNIKNPLRKLLIKLRTVENTHTKTLAHEKNSRDIELKDVQPGDMIIMLDAGISGERDHVLIVNQIDYENNNLKTIHYAHSLNWASDGKYNHGVRQGTIEITDINKHLAEQRWIEQEKTGDGNETFARTKKAKKLSIRRLISL